MDMPSPGASVTDLVRTRTLALIGAASDAGRMADAARLLDELAQSTGNSAFGEAAAMVRKAAGAP